MRQIKYSIFDPETKERFTNEEQIESNSLTYIYSCIDLFAGEKFHVGKKYNLVEFLIDEKNMLADPITGKIFAEERTSKK